MGLTSLFLGSGSEPGSLEWEREKAEEIRKADLVGCVKILKALGDKPKLVGVATDRISALATSFTDYDLVLREVPFHLELARKIAERMFSSAYDREQIMRFVGLCPDDFLVKERAVGRLADSATNLDDWLEIAEIASNLNPDWPIHQRIELALERLARSDDDWERIGEASVSVRFKSKGLEMRLAGASDVGSLVKIYSKAENGSSLESLALDKIKGLNLTRGEWIDVLEDGSIDRFDVTDQIFFEKALELSDNPDDIIDLRDRADGFSEGDELKALANTKLLAKTDKLSSLVDLYGEIENDSDLEKGALKKIRQVPASFEEYFELLENGNSSGNNFDEVDSILAEKVMMATSRSDQVFKLYHLAVERGLDDTQRKILAKLSQLELDKGNWESIRTDSETDPSDQDLYAVVMRKLIDYCELTSERIALYSDYVGNEGSEGDESAVMMAEEIASKATLEECRIIAQFNTWDDIQTVTEKKVAQAS